MITTICLLILIYTILKRPVGRLTKKLEGINWKDAARDAWDKIVLYSKKAGRSATRVVLKFYYVLKDGELSTLDKALVYAGIIYIVVPTDLLPKKIFGWIGFLDDLGVAAWITNKIGDSITPDILDKVEETLTAWFGPEIVTRPIADFSER